MGKDGADGAGPVMSFPIGSAASKCRTMVGDVGWDISPRNIGTRLGCASSRPVPLSRELDEVEEPSCSESGEEPDSTVDLIVSLAV